MLSSSKDTDFLILEHLSDDSLFYICTVCKYIASLLQTENFWRNRISNRYPLLVRYCDCTSWKQFYLKMMFYINTIEKKWGIPYIASSEYNPETVYKEYFELDNNTGNCYDEVLPYVGETGDINLAKLLFSKGARVMINDLTVEAALHNKLPLLKFLIEEKKASSKEALYGAASSANYKLIEHLISAYDIKNIDHGYMGAVNAKNIQLMEYFESFGFTKFPSALYFASEKGYVNIVEYLLKKHEFTILEKVKSLFEAAMSDEPDVVKLFVEGTESVPPIVINADIANKMWARVFCNDAVRVAKYLLNTCPNLDLEKLLIHAICKNSECISRLITLKKTENMEQTLKIAKKI